MGTQIEIWTPIKKTCEMFYIDSPIETLNLFLPNYNVMGFESIEINNFVKGAKTPFYLFKIKEFNHDYLEPKDYIDAVDFSEFRIQMRAEEDKIKIIRNFLNKYFITTKIKKGPVYIQPGVGTSHHEQKIIENYFESRIKSPIKEKEKNLRDLIDYSKILLDKNLTLPELEEIILSD